MVVETLTVVSYGIVGIGCMGLIEPFQSVENVLYFDWSVGYTGVYVCQNLLSCAFHCRSVFHLDF